MLKKILIGCFLSSLVVSVTYAKEITNNDNSLNIKKVTVNACNPMDRLTDNSVKYIYDDLFLDSIGNKVKPCSKNNEVVFKIIDSYDNGKNLFYNSNNQILNKSENQSTFNINFYKDYTVSYGENNVVVNDAIGFQQNIKSEELDKIIKISNTNNINMDSNIVYDLLNIPKDLLLPDKYKNMIYEEKASLINDKYSILIEQLNQLLKDDSIIQYQSFQKILTNQNRLLLSTNSIINQYPTNIDEDINFLNGESFDLFIIEKTKKEVYIICQKIIRDYISDPRNTIDMKVAFIDYLINNTSIFSKTANDLYQKKIDEWEINREHVSLLNNKGINEFKTSNDQDKEKYLGLLKKVNDSIIENELTMLPNRITRDQYIALSNIDKYKYRPELLGKFVNTKIYIKSTIDEILKLTIKK